MVITTGSQIQIFVISSPKGTICDCLVVMKFIFEIDWGHEVLLITSAKISESEGSISSSSFYGQLPDY